MFWDGWYQAAASKPSSSTDTKAPCDAVSAKSHGAGTGPHLCQTAPKALQHNALSVATQRFQMDIHLSAGRSGSAPLFLLKEPSYWFLHLTYFNLTKTQERGWRNQRYFGQRGHWVASCHALHGCLFYGVTTKVLSPRALRFPRCDKPNNTHLQTWTISIFFSSRADSLTGDLCTCAQPNSCGFDNSLSPVTFLQYEDTSLQPEAASVTHASSPTSNTYGSIRLAAFKFGLGVYSEVVWKKKIYSRWYGWLHAFTISQKSLSSIHSKTFICLPREAYT